MNFLHEFLAAVGSLSGSKRKAAADDGQQVSPAKRSRRDSPRKPSVTTASMPKQQFVTEPSAPKHELPPVVAQQQEQLPRIFVPLVQQPEAVKQYERHRLKPAANAFKQFPDKKSSPLARLSAPATRPRSQATQYFAGSTLQQHSNTPVVGWASGTPQQHLRSYPRLQALSSRSRYKVNHHQQRQQPHKPRAANPNPSLAASMFGPAVAATPAAITPDIKQRLFHEPTAAARSANPYMVNYGSAAAAAAAGNGRADAAATGAAVPSSKGSGLSFAATLGHEAQGLGLGVRQSPAAVSGAEGVGLANGPVPANSTVNHLFAGVPGLGIGADEQKILRDIAAADKQFKKHRGVGETLTSTYRSTLARDINKSLALSSDYQVNPAALGGWQQLQHQGAVMQQQQLEKEAARLQQQRRQLTTSPISPRQALASPPKQQQQQVPPGAQQQQRDQQQQQQEEESSDVICIDTDEGDQDAVQSSEQQAVESEAQEDGFGDDAAGEDGVEGVSDSDEYDTEEGSEESPTEEQEDLEAAAAQVQLQQLHIQQWIGPVSDWEPSDEDYNRYRDATSQAGNLAEILTQHDRSNIELTRAHFGTLARGQWLNDEVINMYMALLLDRDRAMRGHPELRAPKCHFFNTFFLNKLYKDAVEKQHMPADKAYNYQNVRRWTSVKKLSNAGQASDSVLKLDRIIVPVHEGSHWTAAMVDLANKCFVFFDSFHGHNRAALAALRRWLADEAKDKLQEDWDCHNWPELYPNNVPRQTNGCDCGVFAILFCNRLGANMPFDFRQQDLVVNARVRVACELLDVKIPLPER